LEEVAYIGEMTRRTDAVRRWRKMFKGADVVQVPGKSKLSMPFPVVEVAAGWG
jgi:hypothetical protein